MSVHDETNITLDIGNDEKTRRRISKEDGYIVKAVNCIIGRNKKLYCINKI